MHRIREILRQKWDLQRTHREIAASVGCSAGAVCKVVRRGAAAALDLVAVAELDDSELELRVQGARAEPPVPKRAVPRCTSSIWGRA